MNWIFCMFPRHSIPHFHEAPVVHHSIKYYIQRELLILQNSLSYNFGEFIYYFFFIVFQLFIFRWKSNWFLLEPIIIFQSMIRWDEAFHSQSKFSAKFRWCSCWFDLFRLSVWFCTQNRLFFCFVNFFFFVFRFASNTIRCFQWFINLCIVYFPTKMNFN